MPLIVKSIFVIGEDHQITEDFFADYQACAECSARGADEQGRCAENCKSFAVAKTYLPKAKVAGDELQIYNGELLVGHYLSGSWTSWRTE